MTRPHTHWDVARAANTMAVRTTIQIDPTQITPRIKNKLINWLRSGVVLGGYRSEARKLGDMLADKFKLPTTRSHWYGVSLSYPSKELADEVVALMTADWLAFVLEHPNVNIPNHYYYKQHHNVLRELTKNWSTFNNSVPVHDRKFRDQIVACADKHMTDKQRAQIESAVAAITGTAPIDCYQLER